MCADGLQGKSGPQPGTGLPCSSGGLGYLITYRRLALTQEIARLPRPCAWNQGWDHVQFTSQGPGEAGEGGLGALILPLLQFVLPLPPFMMLFKSQLPHLRGELKCIRGNFLVGH